MAKASSNKANLASDINMELYTGGFFKAIVEQCDGCERVIEVDSTKYCKSYQSPDAKWRLGICNFATHQKPELITAKVKVNPLKASKRAMAKRK